MFSVINGKSLTSQRVQLSHPTDRLPHPVLSPSSGRSAPLDKKKTFKCLDISHGNRKDKESLQAIERKHKKTTLVPFGEDLSQALCPKHISENHDISKPLFALERSFTWEWLPPRGGLSGWSPRHCLLPCLTFFITDGDCERSHVDTYDIWHIWPITLTHHGWVWDSVIYHRVHSYCHWITGEHLLMLILISSYFMLSVTRKYLGQWPIYYSLQADITTPKNNSRKWLFSGQKWFLRPYFL